MSFLNRFSLAAGFASNALKTTVSQRALATAVTTPQVLSPSVQAFLRDFKTNEPVSIVDLNSEVFGAPLRRDILHRVVVWQRDCMRQGTSSTKGRADVRGSGRKVAGQKGRGKARIGNLKAPHLRGGGIAFGPKPRDHSTDLPRKVQEFGLRVALSAKYAQDQLTVVETLQDFESHKTRELAKVLEDSYEKPNLLMILNDENEKLELAARNLPNCEVINVLETNVLDLLTYDRLIIEKSAVETLEEVLKTA
ncbi:54S ribosomal protein, mitochondrial [Apophysomyces sp. BC1034]|nr:54S ribosomal protein, mitochondrial [Apophysomyces sp. BC1015]KAG0176812.1 54S ribosomal protein, mitochondrial [Apophysomyces sp. BC1021]KAG0192500.1 54S ribosomal protein, mitochondrial [Apophysomyces sp. BC1034]